MNEQEELQIPSGSDPILQWMQESGIPLTRENYLEEMYAMDPIPDPYPPELETMLPLQFRQEQDPEAIEASEQASSSDSFEPDEVLIERAMQNHPGLTRDLAIKHLRAFGASEGDPYA